MMGIMLKNKNRILVLILLVVSLTLVILGIYNVVSAPEIMPGQISESDNVEAEGWKTYTNEVFNFKIDFPSDWKLAEDFNRASPIINIYKPRFDARPPFDQFSDINAVSIFPRGIETEALIGQMTESRVEIDFPDLAVSVDKAVDYSLVDGGVWATYITFDGLTEPWEPWGSIWATAEIKDVKFSCLSGPASAQIEIELEKCNPFGGDVFTRKGTVDPEIIVIQERILESFRFIK